MCSKAFLLSYLNSKSLRNLRVILFLYLYLQIDRKTFSANYSGNILVSLLNLVPSLSVCRMRCHSWPCLASPLPPLPWRCPHSSCPQARRELWEWRALASSSVPGSRSTESCSERLYKFILSGPLTFTVEQVEQHPWQGQRLKEGRERKTNISSSKWQRRRQYLFVALRVVSCNVVLFSFQLSLHMSPDILLTLARHTLCCSRTFRLVIFD